jgi:hypothetical protein
LHNKLAIPNMRDKFVDTRLQYLFDPGDIFH